MKSTIDSFQRNRLVQKVMSYLLRRSRREQVMLLTLSTLMFVLTFWFGAWEPARAARVSTAAQLAEAQRTLVAVDQLATELVQLRQQEGARATEPGAQSLSQVVTQMAEESGLAMAALEPAADAQGAGIRFESVPMASLLDWLGRLEEQQQIVVDQLTVTPVNVNGPSAPAENIINASLRVRKSAQ
jgi:type II secretory pathway component PulM